MMHSATQIILDTMKQYFENSSLQITTSQESFYGQTCETDYISVDEQHDIGIKIFDNEIIFFYFTGHTHFEDYSSSAETIDEDYITRAISFLKDFFDNEIRHVERYRGKTLAQEKYIILYNDGREECIGNIWYGLSRFINPFGKKSVQSTTWIFDRSKGMFTNIAPKNPSLDALEVIDVSDDCFIEIHCGQNVYTYHVMELQYEEYYGKYYWMPASNVLSSGLYDTKEKAIQYALEAVAHRSIEP